MPGKSRHGKGKSWSQSKRRKGKLSRPTIPSQQPAVAQTGEPVSAPVVPAPRASAPTPMAKPITVKYLQIASELRTIGILAGIMLIILIVLALVLR